MFIRSQVLSRDEWDVYKRVLGGFARTYTEQQAVGREELDAAPAIKALEFSLFDNCLWAVMYTVSFLTSEDVKSKCKALRGQIDVCSPSTNRSYILSAILSAVLSGSTQSCLTTAPSKTRCPRQPSWIAR